MPTEPNLHNLFRSSDAPQQRTLEATDVIRRARRRRLPRQIGAGSVSALAIVGVSVAGVNLLGNGGTSAGTSSVLSSEADGASGQFDTADGGGSDSGAASDGSATPGIKRAPADRINLCGGTLAEVAPAENGLVLTADFPDAAVGATSVAGTVTMTNTGSTTVVGYTAATPAVTLSQDGIVLWHSNGPMIEMAAEVNLKPGESMEYKTAFTPVVCAVEDDMNESFREDLPAAPAGEYQVSAAIDLSSDADAVLVTGPVQTVTLR